MHWKLIADCSLRSSFTILLQILLYKQIYDSCRFAIFENALSFVFCGGECVCGGEGEGAKDKAFLLIW